MATVYKLRQKAFEGRFGTKLKSSCKQFACKYALGLLALLPLLLKEREYCFLINGTAMERPALSFLLSAHNMPGVAVSVDRGSSIAPARRRSVISLGLPSRGCGRGLGILLDQSKSTPRLSSKSFICLKRRFPIWLTEHHRNGKPGCETLEREEGCVVGL